MSEPMLELAGMSKGYNRGKPSEVHGAAWRVAVRSRRARWWRWWRRRGRGSRRCCTSRGFWTCPTGHGPVWAGARWAGCRTRRGPRRGGRSVGFIYQFHHLLPEFSALENVVIPQLANGARRRGRGAGAGCWARSGLAARADHRPAALVGGRAAAGGLLPRAGERAEALLADEPTGNLDPGTSDQVFGVLMELVRRDRAFGADRHAQPGAGGADGPGGAADDGASDLDQGHTRRMLPTDGKRRGAFHALMLASLPLAGGLCGEG
jgi:lipoprotein-releasing system ATP-binding protein